MQWVQESEASLSLTPFYSKVMTTTPNTRPTLYLRPSTTAPTSRGTTAEITTTATTPPTGTTTPPTETTTPLMKTTFTTSGSDMMKITNTTP